MVYCDLCILSCDFGHQLFFQHAAINHGKPLAIGIETSSVHKIQIYKKINTCFVCNKTCFNCSTKCNYMFSFNAYSANVRKYKGCMVEFR